MPHSDTLLAGRSKRTRRLSVRGQESLSSQSYLKRGRTIGSSSSDQIRIKKEKTQAASIDTTAPPLAVDPELAEHYIESERDRLDLAIIKPVHVLDSVKGFGLFAQEAIGAGICIGEYTGHRIKAADLGSEEHDKSYAMRVGDWITDARTAGNYTRYINHSDTQENLVFRRFVNSTRVLLWTLRTIEPGEQLLVDYNTVDSYDSDLSQGYLFLNPEDGPYSRQELYHQHSTVYRRMENILPLAKLGLPAHSWLYVTAAGRWVLQEKPSARITREIKDTLSLPLLALSADHQIIDKPGHDVPTPVMVAAFLGNTRQVSLLAAHGANLNQQLNHSGLSSLTLALQGYETLGIDLKKHVETMITLIRSGANPAVHDRDYRTFLHQAIMVLSPQHFEQVTEALHKKMGCSFLNLFQYVDHLNHDILLYCLKNNELDKAYILLQYHSDYFTVHFETASDKKVQFHLSNFKSAFMTLIEQGNDAQFIDDLDQRAIPVPDIIRNMRVTPSQSTLSL